MKVSKKFPKNKSALQDAHRMKKEIEKVRETAKMVSRKPGMVVVA